MTPLTPREIVGRLDRFIIGQDRAKRAVAVAVRNRWRRRQLDPDLAREVAPKNIIMIGPTGVGKTEIARRMSDLVNAPFIKVEASKYTEVGYHGRDVESMIRDLLDLGINMVRQEHAAEVRQQAEAEVERRLVSLLLGETGRPPARGWVRSEEAARHTVGAGAPAGGPSGPGGGDEDGPPDTPGPDEHDRVRARMLEKLESGYFDDKEIEITVTEKQASPLMGMMGPEQMDPGMSSMLESLMPAQSKRRRVSVARARILLLEEETEKLVDNEKINEQAIERTEQTGIIFLDEIDKIAAGADSRSADVSRQGVQRDLLPIVEGSAVNTRYGVVHTDQILFIAAGAFHGAAVSDLMPELQGRFPIRVELDALTKDDFERILIEPEASLTLQQQALLATEGIEVEFLPDSIAAMAELAAEANDRIENIGARRLMTVIEQVFEQISFDAPDLVARGETRVEVTDTFVRERLAEVMKDEDLSRFVL